MKRILIKLLIWMVKKEHQAGYVEDCNFTNTLDYLKSKL